MNTIMPFLSYVFLHAVARDAQKTLFHPTP